MDGNKTSLGEDHLPKQMIGEKMDIKSSRVFDSELSAENFFKRLEFKLLDVNKWSELAGSEKATFQLVDARGLEVDRLVQVGDYLKIDIPGPGTKAGDGFDWVKVENIVKEKNKTGEVLSLVVRPSKSPLSTSLDTAHFLTSRATSTFQVKRVGNVITAEEHARNEVANTATERTLDNIRNGMVALAAMFGFSYPQWKSLVEGLLEDEK